MLAGLNIHSFGTLLSTWLDPFLRLLVLLILLSLRITVFRLFLLNLLHLLSLLNFFKLLFLIFFFSILLLFDPLSLSQSFLRSLHLYLLENFHNGILKPLIQASSIVNLLNQHFLIEFKPHSIDGIFNLLSKKSEL